MGILRDLNEESTSIETKIKFKSNEAENSRRNESRVRLKVESATKSTLEASFGENGWTGDKQRIGGDHPLSVELRLRSRPDQRQRRKRRLGVHQKEAGRARKAIGRTEIRLL